MSTHRITTDPQTIAREAAKKVLTEALNFDLRHPDVHREELPAITAIITNAMEQATAALRAELEEAKKERDQWRDCAMRTDAKMLHEQADHNKTVDRLIAAKAENEKLRAENAEELMRLQKRINDLELEQDLETLRRDRERLIAAAEQARKALEEVNSWELSGVNGDPWGTRSALTALSAALDQQEGQP